MYSSKQLADRVTECASKYIDERIANSPSPKPIAECTYPLACLQPCRSVSLQACRRPCRQACLHKRVSEHIAEIVAKHIADRVAEHVSELSSLSLSTSPSESPSTSPTASPSVSPSTSPSITKHNSERVSELSLSVAPQAPSPTAYTFQVHCRAHRRACLRAQSSPSVSSSVSPCRPRHRVQLYVAEHTSPSISQSVSPPPCTVHMSFRLL